MSKDILQAIDVEKAYLELKLKGDCSYSLIDRITECGFESLDEYFDAKREYLFNKLEFQVFEIPPSECIKELHGGLSRQITSVYFLNTQETTIYAHASKPYNDAFCKENNLTVYNPPSGGGTIVSGDKDIVVAIFIPDNLGISTEFILKKISAILEKYMDNVVIVDNDILVDDGKVCGITYFRGNDMIAFLLHFSFSDVSDLIKSICHLDGPTAKKPSYMTQLDRDTLRMEVTKWLQST